MHVVTVYAQVPVHSLLPTQRLPGAPLLHLKSTQNGVLHWVASLQPTPSSPEVHPLPTGAVEQNSPGQSLLSSQGPPGLPAEHTCCESTQKKPVWQSALVAHGLATKPSVQAPSEPDTKDPKTGAVQLSPLVQSVVCKQGLPFAPPVHEPT